MVNSSLLDIIHIPSFSCIDPWSQDPGCRTLGADLRRQMRRGLPKKLGSPHRLIVINFVFIIVSAKLFVNTVTVLFFMISVWLLLGRMNVILLL
jgi:hypothetical protein